MLFAIVDIETTGSFASANGITEIGIVIHDGTQVVDFFESLVNPHAPIPYFIQRLTGISNAMVETAPSFGDIAPKVHALLHDKVFVAHNVNFDYSFVKHHLHCCGYNLDTRKLCTVRLARKVLPGLPGYSLGKLTTFLGINHAMHHRAGGDALATADLLSIIVARDTEGVIDAMLKGRNAEQYLPQHLPVAEIDRLPSLPGVYYFINNTGKTIYVGKAKNIRRRVKSHFSNNNINRQKQDFIRETHRITCKQCATELMAEILESAEIRRLWPKYNYSQRGYLPQFGLYTYEDKQGFLRITIEKNRNSNKPIYSFNSITEGQDRLRELVREFDLCSRLCNLPIYGECGCETHSPALIYNERATEAINWLRRSLPSFALIDKGFEDNEHSCILVRDGNFYGMGYLYDKEEQLKDIATILQNMEPLQDNDYIRHIVYKHATDFPEKCVQL